MCWPRRIGQAGITEHADDPQERFLALVGGPPDVLGLAWHLTYAVESAVQRALAGLGIEGWPGLLCARSPGTARPEKAGWCARRLSGLATFLLVLPNLTAAVLA